MPQLKLPAPDPPRRKRPKYVPNLSRIIESHRNGKTPDNFFDKLDRRSKHNIRILALRDELLGYIKVPLTKSDENEIERICIMQWKIWVEPDRIGDFDKACNSVSRAIKDFEDKHEVRKVLKDTPVEDDDAPTIVVQALQVVFDEEYTSERLSRPDTSSFRTEVVGTMTIGSGEPMQWVPGYKPPPRQYHHARKFGEEVPIQGQFNPSFPDRLENELAYQENEAERIHREVMQYMRSPEYQNRGKKKLPENYPDDAEPEADTGTERLQGQEPRLSLADELRAKYQREAEDRARTANEQNRRATWTSLARTEIPKPVKPVPQPPQQQPQAAPVAPPEPRQPAKITREGPFKGWVDR